MNTTETATSWYNAKKSSSTVIYKAHNHTR